MTVQSRSTLHARSVAAGRVLEPDAFWGVIMNRLEPGSQRLRRLTAMRVPGRVEIEVLLHVTGERLAGCEAWLRVVVPHPAVELSSDKRSRLLHRSP